MSGLGLAFVGAGVVAELYSKAIERGVSGQFTGVFDPDMARAQRMGRRLAGAAFSSLDALLADAATEAVVVMSPNATHADIARRCLKAGKHVLIEKPVAQTTAEIDELIDLARSADRVCMPAHNYIYNPSLERAKRLIGEGRLGKIASLWILYNIHHDEAIAARYGGVLREVAIHHAYSLIYLLGRPKRVLAAQSRVRCPTQLHEDQVMIVCEMADGVLANLWTSFAADDRTSDPWTVVYKVLGTQGGLNFTWSDAAFEDAGGPAWGVPNYVDSFWNELTFFLDQAISLRIEPPSTLKDARDALLIVEAAERSIALGGGFQHPAAGIGS
jgi:predicted dehydrogenase